MSSQGVQNLGSGFVKTRKKLPTAKRPKRSEQLGKNRRTPDSFDTELEVSDDDLDCIGADDSATNIRAPGGNSRVVFGKKVEITSEYKSSTIPKGLRFTKTRSATASKSPPLQEKNNAGPSTSSQSLQASVARSAHKANEDAPPPSKSKPCRPRPKPVNKRVENPTIVISSQETPEPPKAPLRKGSQDKEPMPIDKPTKRTPMTPKLKTHKANVSTGASPLKPPRRLRERSNAPFPMSPPNQRKSHVKIKRKTIISSDDSSSEDQDKLAAFPMSPSALHELKSSSPSSPEVMRQSPKFGQGPTRKKKRSGDLPRAFSISDDDNAEIASETGPIQLCPYCDRVLPSHPSSRLQALLAKVESKSYPEPRPNNPNARSAPFTTYIIVCQRHEFENDLLPKAKDRGWPLSMDWKSVADRVQAMRIYLNNLITRPDGPERKESSFWHEITNDIKAKGTRAVKGVQGQFENFERIQPGYYGEMGSVIIHQTLFTMFPLLSIDPRTVEPLTPEEFIRNVLVPEVVVQLIIDDQFFPDGPTARDKAIEVMRESAAYGTAMFPEDSGEGIKAKPASRKRSKQKNQDAFIESEMGEEMDVGDMILLERARQRRREIIEEERKTATDESTQKPPARPRARKLKSSSSAMSIDSHSDPLCDSSDIEPLPGSPRFPSSSKVVQRNFRQSTMTKRSSAKNPGAKTHAVDIELSSDGEIMTSNEEGVPPGSSIILDSPTQSLAASDIAIEDPLSGNADTEVEETPRPPKPRTTKQSRSKKGRDGWSHSLADPVDSSTDRSTPPPVKVLKKGHSWLLNDM